MSLSYESIKNEPYYKELLKFCSIKSPSFYLRTFGCQQNEADSERISGILTELGYTRADEPGESDLIILNTCSVRAHAEEKVFSLLGGYKEYKKKNPELIIGVVGCMGANPAARERLKRDFHYVSFTLGAGVMHRLPEVIYSLSLGGGRMFIAPEARECIVEGVPVSRAPSRSKYVSIMYGCDNFCAYCIVPYTRGRERSRDSAEILSECRELVRDGAREITLLGQNVNSYRADRSFPELLSAVAEIEGDFTVRFMTSHPKDVSPELVSVMARYPEKIAPAFHLPLQSGSDTILRDMNRKYDREGFMATAELIKREVRGVYLTTDVIVGYPGESEEDFLLTLDVLKKVRFGAVYAFLYSAREGTAAARRQDTVPEEVKKERLSRLLQLQDEILLRENGRLIGTTVSVFCEKSTPNGTSSGRMTSGRLVHFTTGREICEETVRVKITSVGAYDLVGVEEIEK